MAPVRPPGHGEANGVNDASITESDYDDDDMDQANAPPIHPLKSMQGAFEESIFESMQKPDQYTEMAKEMTSLGPEARRKKLLESEDYNSSYNARWRKTPGAKYHPLWKLMAQISFGVHLLQQHLAKSDTEVVKILHTHVEEVDSFLERTTEDFELALVDVKERINYLRLPLEHVNIFDVMLDDKQFRTSILEGNEKIERIVERTARAMNDSLVDVTKGIQATMELARYLDKIGEEWADNNDELLGIYNAMRGNAEGWYRCFLTLQMKGNTLGVALVQLGSILNEMTKRAGVASRRSVVSTYLHRVHSSRSRKGRHAASIARGELEYHSSSSNVSIFPAATSTRQPKAQTTSTGPSCSVSCHGDLSSAAQTRRQSVRGQIRKSSTAAKAPYPQVALGGNHP
ncbi:hypothetical protein K402DRAFT_34546 [Aulographum hederae CBS 113979]|uniref:Uncharacterized protein n=1 Tax=Aulographum hederae CBS 113979 TaxID=1176131 RepID=A0A6G1H5U5_9PEZI|nr:hypothetical protein K402DRAFT_34546 [Aulographum hederae CBS 113979]